MGWRKGWRAGEGLRKVRGGSEVVTDRQANRDSEVSKPAKRQRSIKEMRRDREVSKPIERCEVASKPIERYEVE